MSAYGAPSNSATIKVGNDGSSSSYGGIFSNNDGQLNNQEKDLAFNLLRTIAGD